MRKIASGKQEGTVEIFGNIVWRYEGFHPDDNRYILKMNKYQQNFSKLPFVGKRYKLWEREHMWGTIHGGCTSWGGGRGDEMNKTQIRYSSHNSTTKLNIWPFVHVVPSLQSC